MARQENSVNPRAFERHKTLGVGLRYLIISAIRMALFILMIFPLLPKETCAASIAFVQVKSAVPQTPQTSVTVTYTKAQTAGDLDVVVIGWNDSTAQISSVTDSKGNAYALAVGPTVQSGKASQAIYYAKNIVAAAAGANSVTVAFNTGANSPDIRIAEYSGVDPVNPVDVVATAQGTGTVSNSGSVTTGNANDLLIGASLVQQTTTGPGSGYTSRVITSPDGDILEDRIATTAGSYSATAAVSGGAWIMQMVAFCAAGSGGGGTAPTITSASSTTFTVSAAGNFTVTTTGSPTPSLSESGALPTGVAFTNNGNGTATLSGTPGSGTAGTYSLTFTASNGVGTPATQSFTLTVNQAPGFTSASSTTFTGGTAGTFTVATTGTPTPSLSESGPLPTGVKFTNNGNGTATLGGTPGSGAGGSYPLTFTASNGVGTPATQSFTLTVNQAPVFTSANGTTFAVGTAATFTVTTTGTPTPSLSESGQLPTGVTFTNNGDGTATVGGTPESGTAGSYSLTFTASNGVGTPASQPFTLTVTSGSSTSLSFVQVNSAVPQTPQTSVTVTYTKAQTVGDLNVVVIGWNDSTAQISSVADSQGNAYVLAVGPTVQSGLASQAIYYAENIVPATANSNTVTVVFNTGATSADIRIAEYSGVDPNNPVDVVAAAQGTGATSNSGSVTTGNANDLLIGANLVQQTTTGPGSGYTSRVITSPDGDILEDDIVTTAGSHSATAKLSGGAWIMQMVAFRAAGGGAAPPSITSLTPTSGSAGASITINGTNFDATEGTSTVSFNGKMGTPTSWSATSIVVPVPTGATSGNVTVTVGGQTSNGIVFTVTGVPISVTITPVRGGVTVNQPMMFAATVQNDSANAGVTWSASGGMLSNQTASTVTFAAATAGAYTITATSNSNGTKSASAVIGVTDLASVSTWRNDVSRSGVNSQEFALTMQNVATSSFGKLFSCSLDGWVFAQPLWTANVLINGAQHNVVYVASENDSLYAFDADGPGCKSVWSSPNVSLIPSGEKIVPLTDLENDSYALGPITGITGTPVIDPSSQTLYLVALTENSTTGAIIHRLHAIDITTGQERAGSPVVISASVSGTGYDNSNGTITFAPKMEKQRAALLLLNGIVYVCWASYNDTDFYHGWVIGYATALAQVAVFNDTPDGGRGGIWMSGGGPAADSQGNVYLLTGNGDFNANSTGGRNYGDTFVKLGTSGGLSVSNWFTPFDQATLAADDLDLGGGGAVILIDQTSGPYPHLTLGGGKSGTLYVVNRDNLGQYNPSNNSQIVQSFVLGANGIYSAPLFWQNTLYAAASAAPLSAYPFSSATSQFQTTPASVSSESFGYPGATPALSVAGTNNGILWAIEMAADGTAVLHAYDSTNLNNELWNSSQAPDNRDEAGAGVKFTVPTIANGKAYIGTQTELDVFGLLSN